MVDTKLLAAKKKLEASPHLTNEEYNKIMSHQNDEENIDNLNFDKKNYDILDHIS